MPSLIVAMLLGSLAIVILRAKRRDSANRSLALFLGLVAGNYLLVAISDFISIGMIAEGVTRPGLGHPLLALAYALQILDPVALVLFVTHYPVPLRRRRLLVGAVVLVALGLEVALAVDPASFYLNRLSHRLVETYISIVYLLVLYAFARVAFGPRSSENPGLPRGFLLGWGVLVILRSADVARRGFFDILARRETIPAPWYGLTLAWQTSVFVVIVAGLAFAMTRPSWSPIHRPAAARLLVEVSVACVSILAALHLGDVVWVVLGAPQPRPSIITSVQGMLDHSFFESRWIFFAFVAGPAFLRSQILDLDSRLRRWFIAVVSTGLMLLLFILGASVIETSVRIDGSLTGQAIFILVVAALVGTQSIVVGRWVADRLHPPENEADAQYRRLRRFEAYRDAAHAVSTGRAPPEGLEELRVRLGLSTEEALLAEVTAPVPQLMDAVLTPGTILNDRYRLEGIIDRGAHGRVFLATDTRSLAQVVVKEIAGAGASETLRLMDPEISAASALRGGSIVSVLDHFVENGLGFLVLERMPGGSLAKRLREAGPLESSAVAKVALDVLAGVKTAHNAGILHRDIKPSNILFDAVGGARLADFGIARLASADVTLGSATSTDVPGTPLYLPPEAFDGALAEPSWDTYAVGTVMLECLTGRPPRPGEEPPPETPPVIARVIRQARSADPNRRYHAAREMIADIERAS